MSRPTNAWFANLIYDTGRLPVAPLPYHVAVTTDGLDVCLPVLDTAAFSTAIIAPFVANLSMRSTGGASSTQKVTAFTDLGVTVVWSGGMTADLVRGSAYATMRYTGVTPVISSVHTVTSVNGGTGPATGTKFKVVLSNGQTWILYTSSSVTVTLAASVLTFGAAFTGTVRAAALPSDTGAEAALDASATCIPSGGSIGMTLSGSTYVKTLTYATTGAGTLLTYAMPHHQDTLTSPQYAAATLTSLRGPLRGVLGASWTLSMNAPIIGWENAQPVQASRLSAVTAALAVDKTFVPTVGDPYFGGKSLAKGARLTSIADALGDTTAKASLLGNLRTVLTSYLTGGLSSKLRYETTWGGVVSEVGLTDGAADFGNGRFNDHYFHYGYTIYAASIVARFDPAWAGTVVNGRTHLDRVNDLVRDIANPDAADTYFTRLRHFDGYEGHSWASGSPAANDGRNQESTSEAVNAWWGVQQWGTATSQPLVRDLGRMLLTEEIRTAQKYWQVKQASNVYPASAFKSRGVVGILWSGKVDYGTWFSAAPECIFGIQALPTNPTTEVLIDPAWAAEVWSNNLASIYAGAQEAWKGPLVGIRAQSDAADAWTKVQALTAFDDGTSKTQMLFHVSTQTAGATAATAPLVPAAPLAVAGDGSAAVSWTAPANGGSPITGYDVQALSGTTVVSTTSVGNVTSTSITTGISNGTAYTFKVRAKNTVGNSAYSAGSSAVTPAASGSITHGFQVTTANTGVNNWVDPTLGRKLLNSDLTQHTNAVSASDFTTAGGTIRNRWFKDLMLIDIDNVTFVGCRFDHGLSGYRNGVHHPFTANWCTIEGNPDPTGYGSVYYQDYTLLRCYIACEMDGLKANGGVTATECVIRCLTASPDDHNDGVQSTGSYAGNTIQRCNIDARPLNGSAGGAGGPNAALFVADNSSGLHKWYDNLVAGGGYVIRCYENSTYDVQGNWVLDQSWLFGPAARAVIPASNVAWGTVRPNLVVSAAGAQVSVIGAP